MKNPYLQQAKKNKEAILLEHAGSVKFLAQRLAARLPAGFELDDLIQVGMIGLMDAIDKFDPTKAVKFKTYAEFRIKGAMLDELRSRDWIPRSVRENSSKLEKAFSKLRSNDNIDHPTDQELAGSLDIDVQDLNEFLDKARPIPLLSIENLGHVDQSDDQLDILETISKPEAKDPIAEALEKETQESLIKAIKKLPEKEQMVLSLYYNEDMNLKEIAAVFDITESRVSQIRTKAIGMLRSYMKNSH